MSAAIPGAPGESLGFQPAPSTGDARGARIRWVRFHHSESATAAAISRPPPAANHEAMSMCLRTTVKAAGSRASAVASWSESCAR